MEETLIIPIEQEAPKRPRSFYIRRMFIYLLNAFTGSIVFFHRHCPNIVATDMAHSYGEDVQKLSIFSSMFYYAFAFMQPFTGVIADIIEPGFIVGTGSLLSAIGAFLSGVSNNLAVGSVGRIITGIGCSQIYISSMKCFSNWFELKYFGICGGFYNVIASLGSIASQFPLAAYAELVGWRWSFHTIGFVGVFFSILSYIFVRGNPEKFGYDKVNPDSTVPVEGAKAKCVQLWSNLKVVSTNKDFWLLICWALGLNGPFFNVSGMWGGPFLTSIYGWTSKQAGMAMLGFSFGNMVFSIIFPYMANWLKTKKWLALAGSVGSIGTLLPFIFVKRLSFWPVAILFTLFSGLGNTSCVLTYQLMREYFPSAVAATSIGFINAATFLSASIVQVVSGVIIKSYGTVDGNYTEKGYKIGLWIFSIITSAVGCVFLLLARDSDLSSQPSVDEEKDVETESDISDESEAHAEPEINEI